MHRQKQNKTKQCYSSQSNVRRIFFLLMSRSKCIFKIKDEFWELAQKPKITIKIESPQNKHYKIKQ